MQPVLVALARLPVDCGSPASCRREQDQGPGHALDAVYYVVMTVGVLIAVAVLVIVAGILVWARQKGGDN